MPSTTAASTVLDADHHHRGDVRVRARADQRAEVQLEVGAELQPPVRMRQRHRALDVVLHRLRRRVRQVVDRQDDDVVAHADAAVLALVAPESAFRKVHVPTLRFDVMDVQMLALADRLDHLADVDAVLDHRVAGLVVLERDLVADRDVALRRHHREVLVVFHDPAGERLAGLHAFDHDDADAIAFFVDNEMNHGALFYSHVRGRKCAPPLPAVARRPGSFDAPARAAPLRVLPLLAGCGVRLSDAGQRGAVDPAHRRPRASGDPGALGGLRRRRAAYADCLR